MAVTVSAKNYTLVNDCEDEGLFVGLTGGDVSDFFKYGTQCCGYELWGAGLNTLTVTSNEDFSGVCHVRWWMMTTVLNELDTDANGGVQFWCSDGGNTGYWNVTGSTTYPGGWYNPVIDLSRSVDAGTKPAAMGSITTWGFRFNLTDGAKKTQSLWIDHVSTCDGLVISGDDGGGYFNHDAIVLADLATTLATGCIREIGGVIYLTGLIECGLAASATKFQAKSQTIIFENRPVNADLYSYDIVDDGINTTEFILGNKVGTAGVQGCLIRVESISQTAKFDIDGSTDTDVDNFKLYGTTFFGGDSIDFAGAAAAVEILGCSFEACGQIDPDDASVLGCFFIDTSDGDAALLWNESIDISSCSFIGNTTGAAIEMPSAVGTPYDYDALSFSGNTNDVLNSSGSAISISKSNGSNPTTSEGSTVNFLSAAVTVQATITDSAGEEIENALVYLQADAKSSGTATTDTTDKLVDTNATFETNGVAIGDTAFNQTDGTSTLVTAVDSETSLSLASDAFPDGNEDYRVGGPLPDKDVVTIVNSGTTATVTHVAHNMVNNDHAYIEGGSLIANEGVFQITYISVDSYSYTMGSTPGSSPTGTILSTFVGLFGLTNASGVKNTSRVYGNNQLLVGWGRKATSSPYYEEAPIRGTVDSASGLFATGVLVLDE